MTGSLCTLWIRLLGSEPNLQLFTEGGRVSGEACLYCGMGLLAAGKLSPQPHSARHCINTGERQGSYREKLYGEAGDWSWAAQSLLCTQQARCFTKKLLRPLAGKHHSRGKSGKNMPGFLNGYSFWDQASDHENLKRGILGHHQDQRLLSQSCTSYPMGFGASWCCFCCSPTRLGFISHLKLIRVLSQDGGGTRGLLMLIYSSEVQEPGADLPGGSGLPFPSPGLPAAGSPWGMWGRNACTASWGSLLHPPLMSWMNLTVSWYLHANAEKTRG